MSEGLFPFTLSKIVPECQKAIRANGLSSIEEDNLVIFSKKDEFTSLVKYNSLRATDILEADFKTPITYPILS